MFDEKDLEWVMRAHRDHPNQPSEAVRRFDSQTPYAVHPILCGMMIMQEQGLAAGIREDGGLALLYHDVIEDTSAKLPPWLSENVAHLVNEMTFDSPDHEKAVIFEKDPIVRLLKLYDKVSNLMDRDWSNLERSQRAIDYITRLCDDVEQNWGELNVTVFARALINNYSTK